MSVAEIFAALGRGERPADDGLLFNCRLEWQGGEAYGEEAILESFGADPLVAQDGMTFAGATAAAWVGDDAALFADVHDGRLVRLWRLGGGSGCALEPAVAVAFDPDLNQTRGGVYARAQDHPTLAAGAFAAVVAAGQTLIAPPYPAPLHRVRAFVLRAFSAGDAAVALFAVHQLSIGPVRAGGFTHALALVGEQLRLVHDHPNWPEWTPRL